MIERAACKSIRKKAIRLARNQKYIERSKKPKYSLYLRFPFKLSTNKRKAEVSIKAIHNKIIGVRFPRQKSARFCLVDFESVTDKRNALPELKSTIINGRQLIVKNSTVNNPVLLERRKKLIAEQRDAKRTLMRLTDNIKKNTFSRPTFGFGVTNLMVLLNLPNNCKESDIRSLFNEIIDIEIDQVHECAYVTLSTPKLTSDTVKTRKEVLINGVPVKLSMYTENLSEQFKIESDEIVTNNDS